MRLPAVTRAHVLALVQAGGAGGRMDVLTRERAKPTLPFAGVFQLVDFSLSNLVNSGITDVWLSVQFQGAGLGEEVANGRPWDLDRNRGGLRLLMPQEGAGGTDEEGFAKGNADELYRFRDQVVADAPEVLVVMSADHIYRFDVMDAVATHRRTGAECTIVTTTVPVEEATDHATVESDADGTVTGFAYKPEAPSTGTVATEIFVYDPAVLVRVLEELHRDLGADAGEGDTGLGDYGDHLIPHLVDRGRCSCTRWRATGRTSGSPTSTSLRTMTCSPETWVSWAIRSGRSSATSSSGRRRGYSTGPRGRQPAEPRCERERDRHPQRPRAGRGRRAGCAGA